MEYLVERPAFSGWDKRALDAYVDCGMRAVSQGDSDGSSRSASELTLKCRPATEAGYYGGAPGGRGGPTVWPQLGQIGAASPVELVAGELSLHMDHAGMGTTAEFYGHMAKVMGPRTRYRVVPEASHFVVMEKPGEIARVVARLVNAALASTDVEGAGGGARL